MTLYDTADSMAMRMWSEYNKHYFGDFRHDGFSDDFRYDVTTGEFKDSARAGYGFAPDGSSDLNQQFFFDSLQVFQIFGKHFVEFDLINPKITAFDPDELSYEDSGTATINLTIAYEAIIYRNDGAPLPVSSERVLVEAFADKFGGTYLDLPEPQVDVFTPRLEPRVLDRIPVEARDYIPARPNPRTYSFNSGGGVLGAFGSFIFGAIESAVSSNVVRPTLASDLVAAAIDDPVLASVLNLASARKSQAEASSEKLADPYAQQRGIDGASLDVAQAAVNSLGGRGQVSDPSTAVAITQGAIAAARTSGTNPRDQIGNGNWNSASSKGLTLSDQAYGIINAQRKPSSQIGYNAARRRDT